MNAATWRQLAGFFGRCFLLSAGLQLFALGMLVGLHDWAYEIHSKLFSISPEVFDQECYHFLGTMKMLGLTLFLVPWAGCRLMASSATPAAD